MTRTLLAASLALVATPALGQAVVKVATVDAAAMPDFRDRLQSALLESGAASLDGARRPRSPDA